MVDYERSNSNIDASNEWWQFIGRVYRYENLPLDVQENDGLITLTTSDGVKFCPVRQFDPNIVTDRGSVAAVVNPWVSCLWRVVREFEGQLGSGDWTNAVRVLHPLQGTELSLIDRIFAAESDDERRKVIVEALQSSDEGAAMMGVELTLPDDLRADPLFVGIVGSKSPKAIE